MFGTIQEKLTIWQIEKFLGGYRGKRGYKDDEVYLFSSEIPYAGRALSSFNIAVNEKLFEDGNDKTLEMIYLHEKQHLKDHVISVFTGISQVVILSPQVLALNSVFLFLASASILFEAYPLFFTSEMLVKMVSLDLVVSLSAVFFSQVGEIRADLNAFDEMGYGDMKEAKENLRDQLPEPGWLTKLSIVLTHPTLEMVERVHERF